MSLLNLFPKSWLDEDADILPIVLNACQLILDNIESQITLAKLGLNINTATGQFLNMQGNDFNVIRVNGESDKDYSLRILEEMLKQRNTLNAITSALITIDANRKSIVYEPWKNLFTIGQSDLSGTDYIIDYEYWNYHVIDIITRIANADLVALVISKILAAGKTLYVSKLIEGIFYNRTTITIGYMDFQTMLDAVSGEYSTTNYTDLSTHIDFKSRYTRYLTWSPCIPVDNNYQFADGVEVPNLQVGWRIKNERQGVDY